MHIRLFCILYIICLLCCLTSTDAQISFTNASAVQVTISDQYARDGEWTKKMAYIVNSGGDNTTGQVCVMREQMCMHGLFVVVKVTAVDCSCLEIPSMPVSRNRLSPVINYPPDNLFRNSLSPG